MTNDEKELVERMQDAWNNSPDALEAMPRALAIVKANIGKIAEVCPRCKVPTDWYVSGEDDDDNPIHTKICPDCHGTGITLKGK